VSQKPDTATAKDNGGGFEPHSEGQFPMVCVDVVNLGVKVERYGDGDPRETEKAALVFASGERHDKDGTLRLVTVEMTLSMNEKANMRAFLESWRGKSYTPEQAAAGVPLHQLQGRAALVTIEHVLTKRGRQFGKIRSISPLPKVMTAPATDVLGDYTRPVFLEERKKEYAKQLVQHRGTDGDPGPQLPDDDDDLPF